MIKHREVVLEIGIFSGPWKGPVTIVRHELFLDNYVLVSSFEPFFTLGREPTKVSDAEPKSAFFLFSSLSNILLISNPIWALQYLVVMSIFICEFVSSYKGRLK